MLRCMVTFSNTLAALNTATLALFANCTATWSGGSCSGMFDTAYLDTLGMANSEYTLLVNSADIAALATTTQITINAIPYNQRERRPDGAGMVRIVLEPA